MAYFMLNLLPPPPKGSYAVNPRNHQAVTQLIPKPGLQKKTVDMPPPRDPLLSDHFKLDPLQNTSECKYCNEGWKNLQLARAKCHFTGEKGRGISACPSVPAKLKEKLVKEAEAREKKKKEAVESKQRLADLARQKREEEGEEPAPKRQQTLLDWQKQVVARLDKQWAKTVAHTGPTPNPNPNAVHHVLYNLPQLHLTFLTFSTFLTSLAFLPFSFTICNLGRS